MTERSVAQQAADLHALANYLGEHFQAEIAATCHLLGYEVLHVPEVVIPLLEELLMRRGASPPPPWTVKAEDHGAQREAFQRCWVKKQEVFALAPMEFTETYY